MSDVRASQLSCTLNSACDCVHVLCSVVEVMGHRYGLGEKQTNRMVLAVDELFANIGQHGYHGKEGTIEMRAIYDGQALRFEFRDYAKPIRDADALRRRSTEINDVYSGGLGLHLIHASMDEVSHQALSDGNRWLLTKYVRGRKTVEA